MRVGDEESELRFRGLAFVEVGVAVCCCDGFERVVGCVGEGWGYGVGVVVVGDSFLVVRGCPV